MRWIPNALTAFRGFFVSPVLVAYFYYESTHVLFPPMRTWAHVFCLVLVVAGVLSDLDGAIARRYGWKTKWGEKFDPLADKLFGLAMLGVISLYFDGWRWDLIVIPAGMIFVYSTLTTIMRARGTISTPSRIAQWKTAVLMIAKIAFALTIAMEWTFIGAWLYFVSLALLWLGALMCIPAIIGYLPSGVRTVPAE